MRLIRTVRSKVAALLPRPFLRDWRPSRTRKAEDYQVDLALVLAIDCSFSVDSNEFRSPDGGPGPCLPGKGNP